MSERSWILRLAVALSLIFLGMQHVLNLPGFVSGTVDALKDTFVPVILLTAVLYVLPFLQVITGAWLVSGQYTYYALWTAAAVMLVLQFGNLLSGEPSGAVETVIYIIAIALAFDDA